LTLHKFNTRENLMKKEVIWKFINLCQKEKEEKICYKMIYYTLCLDSVNRQKLIEMTRKDLLSFGGYLYLCYLYKK